MTRFARRRGIIFILSAPSGAGKTTLTNGLREHYPEIKLSVSCTTRARRNGEIFHATGLLRLGRDAALRMLGPRLLDVPWLYGA